MKFGHSLEHCGRPRVIILGATFRTNNLVDSVLTAGTIECTLHMFAAAETIIELRINNGTLSRIQIPPLTFLLSPKKGERAG